MLSVSDGVTDDRFEEDLENVTSFLVNKAGDTLDTTTTSETTDGRLGDALDIISKDFAVAFGAALSKTWWRREASEVEQGDRGRGRLEPQKKKGGFEAK